MSEATQLDLVEAITRGMTIAWHAQQAPDRKAVITDFGNRTFAELNARCNQLARVFRNAGLQPDDSVAMLMINRPEFVEIYYACQRAGLRITPINWHLTGDNASYIVGNCEASAFIADARCTAPAIEALQVNGSQLKIALATGGNIEGFDNYEDVVSVQDHSNIENPEIGSQMLYTSGTTGRPKGVHRPRVAPAVQTALATQAAANIAANAATSGTASNTSASAANDTVARTQSAAGYVGGQDLALCTGPAYHAAPLAFNVVSPLTQGVGTVLMDKWDAASSLELIAEHRITHTHMVATMFHRLLALPAEVRNQHDISSLRYILHGAAPCPVHVKHAMMDWVGEVIYEYYAATEGGGGFFIGPEEWLQKPGSVGKAPPTAHNVIMDDNHVEVEQGEVGTIYFRAPEAGRFTYYKDPDKTSSSYKGDYFTLGDMGYFDEDGYLFLTGRSAETIISGGVNIYPQETDDVLLKHPAVADVCTVGVPNEEWGEEVKSVVMLEEGIKADEAMADELIGFARDGMPAFKAPRTIDFVEDLPRLPSGKIQRRLVRAPYWEGRARQI